MDQQQVGILQPTQDWMILEEDLDSTTKIHLPDSAKRSGMTVSYVVKAIGPGHYEGENFVIPEVRVDDHVLLDVPAVAQFTYKGREYKAGMARNVAFIVREEGKDVD